MKGAIFLKMRTAVLTEYFVSIEAIPADNLNHLIKRLLIASFISSI